MQPTRSRSVSSLSATFAATFCAAMLIVTPLTAQSGEAKANLQELRAEAREALQSSDWKSAVANFRKVVEAEPEDGTSWQLLGYSLHAMGKLDEALKIHKKAAKFPAVAGVASYNAACVHALQGDKEAAFTWLEKAAEAGFDRPEHIANDPDMDSLRKDERYGKIMAKISGHAGPERVQVYVVKNERKCARVAWFGRNSSPGQIAIDYSPVKWQAKYDEAVDSEEMIGKKWRLGADFWTSLDTSIDLKFGDTEVPAGYYYLTLVQNKPGVFVLGVHDAASVKKMRMDAYVAHMLPSGIEVSLSHEKTDEARKKLAIGITVDAGSQDRGEFAIHFGGHRLSSPVTMAIGKKKAKKADKSGY